MNRKIIADLGGFIQERYGVNLKEDITLLSFFTKVVERIDDQVLSNYFSGQDNGWHSGSSFETRRTGRELVDRINNMNAQKILDVGCGDNELKQYFGDKLTGIDPYNNHADIQIGIMEYKTDTKYDVVLVLGSLNFGDEKTILTQLAKAVTLCKPNGKIFLRANPGITHDHEKAKWIDFYEWSHEKVEEFANQLGCTVNELGWDHDESDEHRWGNRIYAELTRNAFRK